MALGSTGLNNFKPQRRETTANLLMTSPVATEKKKEEKLQIRINGDLYLVFKELCDANQTNASTALRNYIENSVRRGKL